MVLRLQIPQLLYRLCLNLFAFLLLFILSTYSASAAPSTEFQFAPSSAPTTTVQIFQDFEAGVGGITAWWNATSDRVGPDVAYAYEGSYTGVITPTVINSGSPIWNGSSNNVSSYERICLWVFDESVDAGQLLDLTLRNQDGTVTTSSLRNTQLTSPGEWRKLCWSLADFDTQAPMSVLYYAIVQTTSIPELSGVNLPGGPIRIDYVHFETAATSSCAANEVGGQVFLDFNNNGVRDNAEIGYVGATVTLYDSAGGSDTVTANSDGYYSSTAFSAGTDLRVELTIPSSYESSAAGNTSVLFAQAGSCGHDMGIYQTTRYCEDDPTVATACYVAGQYNGTNATLDAIVSFPHTAQGIAHGGTPDLVPTHAATIGDVGTTWGLAYQRQTETLYTSAFVKRLSDLGPLGTGGLYKIDYTTPATPVVSTFVNISSTLNIDTGANPRDGSTNNGPLSANGLTPVRDQNAYDNMGKISMGGLDVADDGDTLWLLNLHDRSLYGIANLDPAITPVPGDVLGPYAMPNPGCSDADDVRPWAVKYHDGQLYIGVVCSAESTGSANDLHAYILRFNPNTSSFDPASVFDFSLTERVGCVFWVTEPNACSWRPWGLPEYIYDVAATTFDTILNPQPILSGIEFDMDGSMVLSFMDRHGHQSGLQNYSGDTSDSNTDYGGMAGGDIVRLCYNNGSYELESGGICANGNTENGFGGHISGLPNTPYGTGEYYQDDTLPNDTTHSETASGGIALLPGSGSVVYSAMNPIGNFNSGGVRWNSNTTGLAERGYELYQQFLPNPTFGKATGIGDVELMCSLPAIEIGNRVWQDIDQDGVQDPNEPTIAGAVVELLDNSQSSLATVTTDSNGHYYFSSGIGTNTISSTYAISGLMASTTGFQIRINQSDAALSGLQLTQANQSSDLHDSDAIESGGYAVISVNTGVDGANNHTYDFGFMTATATIELTKTLNTPQPLRPGETVMFTIQLSNTGQVTSTTLAMTDTYNTAYLEFIAASITPDDSTDDGQLHWSDLTAAYPNGFGQDLAPNASFSVIVTFTAQQDTSLLPGGLTDNVATVYTQSATASVQILNATAINLLNQSVQAMADHVEIRWQTATESDIAGFYLHRRAADSALIQLTDIPIPAQNAGQSIGATYLYQDELAALAEGVAYLLEILSTTGERSYVELGTASPSGQLFLPFISR